MRHDVGAFIFEIARSEIGYTEQRPGEYAACVLAAAIAEGFRGPVFIQGDHFQASAKKWVTEEGKAAEIKALESLIDEAIAAEFYNIDIDTSTLVDLDVPDARRAAARRTTRAPRTSRSTSAQREPKGSTISIGGEIGEVGKYNTQPDEVRAYIDGVKRELGDAGMAKISVQTGTSHGGVPLADGTIAAGEDRLRRPARDDATSAASEYGIAGSVQHGASTLPESVFNKFPESRRRRDPPRHRLPEHDPRRADAPAEMKDEIREFCFANCPDERKASETDEQFVYKTRKKAHRPVQAQHVGDGRRRTSSRSSTTSKTKFEFLMEKLARLRHEDVVAKYVPRHRADLPEYAAASAELTAAAAVDPNEGEVVPATSRADQFSDPLWASG